MKDGAEIVAHVDAVWEEPARASPSAAPMLAVDGSDGPLDWLLELARAERIDLRKLSILQLVEAFARALAAALSTGPPADLSRWGEFLAMAAQLTLLRSRLLLPPEAAQAEAEALRRQLLEADAMRQAARWLEARPQLGREVFGRFGGADAREGARGSLTSPTCCAPASSSCGCRSTPTLTVRRCRSCGGCRMRWRGSARCWRLGSRGSWRYSCRLCCRTDRRTTCAAARRWPVPLSPGSSSAAPATFA